MAKVRPQVIDDEEHERIYERVAAVDVAKDSGMVCARTPHPSRPGGRQSAVWTVKARRNAIAKLGRQLSQDGIEMVTLESTITGGSGFTCWRRPGWPCSWSTPPRPGTCRAGPNGPVNRTPWRSRRSQDRLIISLKLLTCPGPSMQGHNGGECRMRDYRKRTYGLIPSICLLLAAACHPRRERTCCRRMALDLAMRIVHEEGHVSSEKTSWMRCGWPG